MRRMLDIGITAAVNGSGGAVEELQDDKGQNFESAAEVPAEAGLTESTQSTGRLSSPPNPILFRLLYEKQAERDLAEVLPHLLKIDAAHVVMLSHTRLLSGDVAAQLLQVNRELSRLMNAGRDVLPTRPQHRGFYFLYEQEYIHRLGQQVGGAAHLARSRNDINATVTRSRLREELLGLLTEFCKLSHIISAAAQKHSKVLLCGFTHMQPAQPSTLGHYLAAVLSELLRSAELLDSIYNIVNSSPMGAAAGLGTSFPIDRGEVAQLLGFSSIIHNSADAVASRDYLVHVLSAMAMLGISLTRFATDFQIWSSAAYGFLGWGDDLVSTSSIMPQKRNAFIWENVRGKAISPIGSLVTTLTGMKNVSFNNTVEVSAEASSHIWPALKALLQAIHLVQLLIEHLQIYPEKMRDFLVDKQTTMTAVADLLVARHGLAFRTAHDCVSRLVGRHPQIPPAREVKRILEKIVAEITSIPLQMDETELAMALDPTGTAIAAKYGGGPGPAAVHSQVRSLVRRVSVIERELRKRRQDLRRAEERLRETADEIIAQKHLQDI